MSDSLENHQTVYSCPSIINNFSELPIKVGVPVFSTPFQIGHCEFKIRVYPGGNTETERDWISIFLELLKPSAVRIQYVLSILDLDGSKRLSRMTNSRALPEFIVGTEKYANGFRKFISYSEVVNSILKSTNDQLIILCEIFDLKEPESLYALQRITNYGKYLNDEQYSDVKIMVKSKTIHAHKIVLVTGSEVLAAMFEQDPRENRENVIKIKDVKFEVMFELIRFIYTGQVFNIEKIVKELLIAADKYQVCELKTKCSKYLSRLLSNYNVLELLTFADHYNVDDLKTKSIDHFLIHRKDIVKTPDFEAKLKKMKANLIAQIITDLSNS
ncbi:hypothetical protein QAD02_016539 [Eretmocerus hayati]|uniref:Uncharacterized protein n=1 Tax=Eretmocerus hayati TaxID=131215 RepID=A0ACC2PBR9_9HYME|nr:hypothetical protein QAD02_016539 [Eretmocerus hayati]